MKNRKRSDSFKNTPTRKLSPKKKDHCHNKNRTHTSRNDLKKVVSLDLKGLKGLEDTHEEVICEFENIRSA